MLQFIDNASATFAVKMSAKNNIGGVSDNLNS